ncbi:MAG: MFS transporter [Proteobacteria bacterium]|nr:MAG: MFS transporter [Pseudomonadota bacterium]
MDGFMERSIKRPWLTVPLLYFQHGLPVFLVTQFSVLLYKKLGIDNRSIIFWTSLLGWPWILRMFWSPLVDKFGSNRTWLLTTHAFIGILLMVAASVVTSPSFFVISLFIFALVGLVSATHETALDGLYLSALNNRQQVSYTSIKTTAFRLAMIFCGGTIVSVAALAEKSEWSTLRAWQAAFFTGGFVYEILSLYAIWATQNCGEKKPPRIEPIHSLNNTLHETLDGEKFIDAFRDFFKRPNVVHVLVFLLFARFSENMVNKVSALFLIDDRAGGGLALTTHQIAWILGYVGVVFLALGGLVGGWAVSKFGMRKCLMPMALATYLPNLAYWWAAATLPSAKYVAFIVGVDQFGYGFGMSAYLVYAVSLCRKSKFQATHYAVAIGIMSLGCTIAEMLSGVLQSHFGYTGFFGIAVAVGIPSIFLRPKVNDDGSVPDFELPSQVSNKIKEAIQLGHTKPSVAHT